MTLDDLDSTGSSSLYCLGHGVVSLLVTVSILLVGPVPYQAPAVDTPLRDSERPWEIEETTETDGHYCVKL